MLKVKVIELHAEFWVRGRGLGCEVEVSGAWGLGGAGSGLPRRFEHLATGRWSPKVSEKVRAWRGEQGDSRDEHMSLE